MIEVALMEHLDAAGLVDWRPDARGGDAFVGFMPSEPERAVMVITTGGFRSDSKLPYDTPTVQFLVRGSEDPRVAHDRAKAIYSELEGLCNRSIGTTVPYWVVSILGVQAGPIPIGKDEAGRYEYSINFDVEYKSVTVQRAS